MLLGRFFRGDIGSRPAAGIQELLRAILIRANFVPAVRYGIGWRGLKQSVDGEECWTAKIAGFAGVFGLSFDALIPEPGWFGGRFLLHYFPDPGEALVEYCSLRAAAETQRPDYLQKVRDFSSYPEVGPLFAIGCIRLSAGSAGEALALELESISTQRTISEEGVLLPGDGRMVRVIVPGGFDQDFPALEVAFGFFDSLAASVTYNLEQPPVYLSECRLPAPQIVYDRTGGTRPAAAGIWKLRLLLGYGAGRFGDLRECGRDPGESAAHRLCWRSPEPPPPEYRDRLWWRAHQLQDFKSIDKTVLGIDARPPFILLSGFLGAGKTSLLQHFIEYQTQRSRFVAVIQNEVGEIGLDGKLLDYTVTEIDEGCVCCSLAGSLKRAVQGIIGSFSPDAIILETSGLANPKNLLDDLGELAEWVRIDAVVTVVDALNFDTCVQNYTIAMDQVAAADVLILNKSDLANEKRLRGLRDRLRQINPHAPIIVTCRGDVNPAMIFDTEGWTGSEGRLKAPSASLDDKLLFHTHLNDHLCSRTIRLPKALDRRAFFKAVKALPASVFRAKGIVDLAAPPQTLLFQYVGGRFDISEFADTRVQDRFLTFIGKTKDLNTLDAVEGFIRAAEA